MKTTKDSHNPVIYIIADGVQYQSGKINSDRLRPAEKEIVTFEGQNNRSYIVVFDARRDIRLQAYLGMGQTLLVICVLAVGSLVLTKITIDLVITPIEIMMEKVKRISENPLKAAAEEENEQLALEEEEALEGRKKNSGEMLETEMLQQTLVKIGGLLALGFGEAGSQIIAKNMSGTDDINPMLPGQKIISIFGFCDIRNFTDATEVLQEGVMVFVNEIGEIVHKIVDNYSGAANKNIGDAFLLVWKFEQKSFIYDEITDDIALADTNEVHQLCDMALISFLKIMVALKRSRTL